MKKKTIIFLCLAIAFLISIPSCFASSLSAGLLCIAFCGLFVFLAFRSAKPSAKTNNEIPQTQYRSTPPPNKSSISHSVQDNTVNSITVDTPAETSAPEFDARKKESKYLYIPIKVAGVTFKNQKGPARQSILRKIRFNDEPFDEYVELSIRQYEYDGKPAYGVYANNMQIGNIPADYVPFIYENIERIESICGIDVYGGGRNEAGYAISYGCKITLRFLKSNPPINIPDTLKISE